MDSQRTHVAPVDLVRRLNKAVVDPRHDWDVHPELNYAAECGLTEADLPGLLAIARGGNLTELDEPVYEEQQHPLFMLAAWRAIVELGGAEWIPQLLDAADEMVRWDELSDECHCCLDALEEAVLHVGECLTPMLCSAVLTAEHQETVRRVIVTALQEFAANGLRRDEIVAMLTALVEEGAEETVELNSTAMYGLVELHCREAAPLIERQFSQNRFDVGMFGDWEAIRELLGVESLGLPMPKRPHNCMRSFRERAGINCFSRDALFLELEDDWATTIQRYVATAMRCFRRSPEGAEVRQRSGGFRWTENFLEAAAWNRLTVNTLDKDTVCQALAIALGKCPSREMFDAAVFELCCFWRFVNREHSLPEAPAIIALLQATLDADSTPDGESRRAFEPQDTFEARPPRAAEARRQLQRKRTKQRKQAAKRKRG